MASGVEKWLPRRRPNNHRVGQGPQALSRGPSTSRLTSIAPLPISQSPVLRQFRVWGGRSANAQNSERSGHECLPSAAGSWLISMRRGAASTSAAAKPSSSQPLWRHYDLFRSWGRVRAPCLSQLSARDASAWRASEVGKEARGSNEKGCKGSIGVFKMSAMCKMFRVCLAQIQTKRARRCPSPSFASLVASMATRAVAPAPR